ncbi:uncharacterized protein DS421_9g286620 [Arachis hypogaea]|nr:uncharacterized protein DS421_9g286620 [Arachis hypogaea]
MVVGASATSLFPPWLSVLTRYVVHPLMAFLFELLTIVLPLAVILLFVALSLV